MSRKLGFQSEAQAIQYLNGLGYSFISKNVHSVRGEIDLVVKGSQNEIVFVEVKYRKNLDERAFESISKKKREALIYTAQTFLQNNPIPDVDYSFGVLVHDNEHWVWIPDAFDGEEC